MVEGGEGDKITKQNKTNNPIKRQQITAQEGKGVNINSASSVVRLNLQVVTKVVFPRSNEVPTASKRKLVTWKHAT